MSSLLPTAVTDPQAKPFRPIMALHPSGQKISYFMDMEEAAADARARGFPSATATQIQGAKSLQPLFDRTWSRREQVVYRGRPGQTVSVAVAELVMEAFVGPKPKGMCIKHLNDNKLDDRLVNLAYVPRRVR